MDVLQEALHKYEKTAMELQRANEVLDPDDPISVRITLVAAKRVRTASTLLTKALAKRRDTLQNQEVHKQ